MPSFQNSNKVWCLTLKSHSKWCHVTRRGLAPRAAVRFSPHPAPPASSPAPQEAAARPSHTLPPAAPSPAPQGRPAPPGSRLAERTDLHIPTFVPRWRPISARGEAGVLGGARAPAAAAAGSRAGRSRPGRAAHSSPAPGPPAGVRAALPARPGPGGQDKEAVRRARARFTCRGRAPQAPRWFAEASRVPRTACAHSTCSTP